MATFQYKARDKSTKLIQGVMGAESENAVAVKLEQMGYIPIAIFPARVEFRFDRIFDRFSSVGFWELNIFTRQLFTLQKAGLPLLNSLNALKQQTTNRLLRNVIEQVSRDIEGGSDFSSALGRHPRVFNALYVNMIKSGEVSGKLPAILERLAVLGEQDEVVRLRIQAAMRYPAIVVIAIVIGFLVLVTLVMPRFAQLYSQFNTLLPMPTQILLGVNYTVTKFWWLLLAVVAIVIVLFRQFITTKPGRFWWNNVQLKVPVIGPLLLTLTMSRFCRITGMLMQSGVPILQILDLVAESVGNKVVAKVIQSIKNSVNEGKGISGPMKASNLFPPIVTQMVAVGEETGKVDELLLHVSDYYDVQADHTIKNLVSLIEPLLIFVLGLAVLFMALGIFLPMWNMMQLFKK